MRRIETALRPRSPLLTTAGLSLAIVGAVLAVAAGSDQGLVMIVGLGLLIIGAATALASADPVRSTSLGGRASDVEGSHGSPSTIQLGRDPEQVI